MKGEQVMSPEENKAIARRLFEEVLNQGRIAVSDEVLAHDYVSHAGATHREDFKQVVIQVKDERRES